MLADFYIHSYKKTFGVSNCEQNFLKNGVIGYKNNGKSETFCQEFFDQKSWSKIFFCLKSILFSKIDSMEEKSKILKIQVFSFFWFLHW